MAKTHYVCNSCGDDACELFVQPPHTKPTHCPLFTDEEQDERANWESDAPANNVESGLKVANQSLEFDSAALATCPRCCGIGWYAYQVGVYTQEQVQCEDCGGTGSIPASAK